jgi:CHC2 zinc finger/Toprim domain
MILAATIERARCIPIDEEVARRGIKLRRAGAELIGLCPTCGGDDRFAVNIVKQIFNCRGCGAKGDVIKLVQHMDGGDFKDAIETLTGDRAAARKCHWQQTRIGADLDASGAGRHQEPLTSNKNIERRNLELAGEIWRATQPLGPEAIAYFANRGIDVDQVPEHGGLRFHTHCRWNGGTTPCIVGRFTTAISNIPRGIWRRPITGEKPMTLGPMGGCVIRLWPDEEVKLGLVLGEGVETTLAAATRITHRGTLLQPAWAACSAGNMESFPVLAGIEALTLLVDNDANGRGQKAAATCAARWSAAGREVTRLAPKIQGADFNDVVIS